MIEILSATRCIGCDVCVSACPTNVFDADPGGGPPVIARQADCQICFMCEAHCPTDALFVAPHACPLPTSSPLLDEEYLVTAGLLGSHRNEIGWRRRRTPGARTAPGPPLPPAHLTTVAGRTAGHARQEGATGA